VLLVLGAVLAAGLRRHALHGLPHELVRVGEAAALDLYVDLHDPSVSEAQDGFRTGNAVALCGPR
jgi:hypothetical protein